MIKRILALIVLLTVFQNSFSQEVYFSTGKNFTTYDFKNSTGATNSNLKRGTGDFFELGYSAKIKNEKIAYCLGFALNEYNNVGGNATNIYSWNSQYFGFQARISYSLLDRSDFDIAPNFGLNIGTIINGEQGVNGIYYDLTKEKEFSGLLATPSLGIQVKYNLSGYGYISFGYNYSKGFNLSNSTDQKLSFSTNQLQFGVHYFLSSCCN
jgi:hypothetical protein